MAEQTQQAGEQPDVPQWRLVSEGPATPPSVVGPQLEEGTEIVVVPKDRPPHSLAEALLAFQADPPEVVKDAEAKVMDKTGNNELYSYRYLSLQGLLAAMRPRLNELGLLWQTRASVHDGKPVIDYSCIHVPSGERDDGVMPMVAGGTMQGLGSAISFARRYAMITYFNLAPDVDEDGALATGQQTPAAGTAGARHITKKRAEALYKEAEAGDVLDKLQLAATRLYGGDVGDCSTKAKAVAALGRLNTDQANRLVGWYGEMAAKRQSELPA